MRIVHVPFCYFPDPVGGTEIYVRDLAREQQRRGDAVMVLAPAGAPSSYLHDGITVKRFTVPDEIADLRELYTSEHTDIEEFVGLVDEFRADVLHVHAMGRAVGARAIERLKSNGTAVVVTYHTPTATCVRGTLLERGNRVCEGALDAVRCTACTLTVHGVPDLVATALARTPASAGVMLEKAGVRGRVVTALRMRELVTLRHHETRSVLEQADHLVAPAEWVHDLLLKLGVPPAKLTLSRQGIRTGNPVVVPGKKTDRLRIVYVGRIEPIKGVHLLVQALRLLPTMNIELHLYGIMQGDSNLPYRKDLEESFTRDARITLHAPVHPDSIIETIAQYDVLAAPSQWLETGPLVVLEAFAAGVPVIGSALGGIAELVQNDVNGLLVQERNAAGWAATLSRLLHEPELRGRLAQGVQPPRTMAMVADDMATVYQQALHR